MPELPEVETIVRELREAEIEGACIQKAIVYWPNSVSKQNPSDFVQQIEYQKILKINRRGKFLVFTLSRDTLLVHLRMTGKFLLSFNDVEGVHTHERVRLYLDEERILHYQDQRKFGKWYLLSNPEEYLDRLGLEPLSKAFSLKAFEKVLLGRKTQIKPFLLNQRYVSGMGNIYVDEALWEAKIHPLRSLHTLSNSEIENLHRAIVLVLRRGVENTGTSLGSSRANYFSVSGRRGGNQYKLNVFRRDGLLCPRCQTKIIKMVIAQRGTHLCPNCQSYGLNVR